MDPNRPMKINSRVTLTIIECESDVQPSMQTSSQEIHPPSMSNFDETPQPSLSTYCDEPMPSMSTYGQDQYPTMRDSEYQPPLEPRYISNDDEYLPKPVPSQILRPTASTYEDQGNQYKPTPVSGEKGQPSMSYYDQDTCFNNQDLPMPNEVYGRGMRPLPAYCIEVQRPTKHVYQDPSPSMQTTYQASPQASMQDICQPSPQAPMQTNRQPSPQAPMQTNRQPSPQALQAPFPSCDANQAPISESHLMVQICNEDSSVDREEDSPVVSQEEQPMDDPSDPKKLYRVTVRQKITRKPGGASLHPAITSQPSKQDTISSMVPPSLRKLICHDQIIIHQKCSNYCLCFIANSQYRVKDTKGNLMFEIKEDSSLGMRCCCCWCRSFTMKITDRENKEVMRLKRPMRCGQCCCCCGNYCMPCCLTEMDVLGGQYPFPKFGRVRQNFSCFTPSFTCHNDIGQHAFHVSGNCCRLPCTNAYFKVRSAGKSGISLGNIIKKWKSCINECCTNAHSLEVQFEKITTVEDRIMMLSSAILIDFLYYT